MSSLVLTLAIYISINYTDSVVVAMSPNHSAPVKPGKFIYADTGGYMLAPTRFTVVDNGDIYIPERDLNYRLRVHRFDKNGKFIRTINLEGPQAFRFSGFDVSANGEVLIQTSLPGGRYSYVRNYTSDGKLKLIFGRNGRMELDDIPKTAEDRINWKTTSFPQLFNSSLTMRRLGNDVVVMEGGSKDLKVLRCYADGGAVAIADNDETLMQARQLAEAINANQAPVRELASELGLTANSEVRNYFVGPDGVFYYNIVTRDKLEIHRVIFDK